MKRNYKEVKGIVRCKDCKHMDVCNAGYFCELHHWNVVTKFPQFDNLTEFFCADGEEKGK